MARPLLVVLPFSEIPAPTLEAWADTVVSPRDKRLKGRSEQRWHAYCAGRAALALAFRERNLKSLEVSPDPDFGYLRVHGRGDLFVNVSHTEKIAVGVLGHRPIGVDVENVGRSTTLALKRAASPEEARYHRGAAISVEGGEVPDGVALWSAKEAFSKALGLGIKFGLHELLISLEGRAPFSAKTVLRGPLSVAEPALHLVRFEQYVISVCGERADLAEGIDLRVCRSLPLLS